MEILLQSTGTVYFIDPPTLTLPHKGGGNYWPLPQFSPSPLMGEGRDGGGASARWGELLNKKGMSHV
jgi:hypothetical protein